MNMKSGGILMKTVKLVLLTIAAMMLMAGCFAMESERSEEEEKNGKIRIHVPDSDTGIRSHTASDSVFHHQAGCEKRDQRTEKRKHIIVDRNLS